MPAHPRQRSALSTVRHTVLRREHVLFVLVGLAVAIAGRAILGELIASGWPAGLANAAQFMATLQLSFVANRMVTWNGRARTGLLQCWRRYQLARAGSALLCVAAFPALARALGTSVAYWALIVAGAAVNFCSDRFWSFSPTEPAPMAGHGWRRGVPERTRRAAVAVAVAGAVVVAAVVFLDQFLVVVSLVMLAVSATTLAFQLYKWWRPENNDPHRYGEPDEPRLPGVILVPMRHEEAVAGHTLERLATLNHPDYWVVPIVDHPDDPGTAEIAHSQARRFPGRVLVCPYPEDTDVHNKPIGLNAAVELLNELQIPYEWVGVADAEDLFHPDLLRMVDYRFRRAGAGIVQCGVQLMNFGAEPAAVPPSRGLLPRVRRWLRANTSGWWRAANVLEYFTWFQSRLKLQAATKVMPLGGNTVFFRRAFLEALHERYGSYWDEDCLTEDCKIGIVASVLGYSVDVVYVEDMVTREETPASLSAFVRQRVRWMQGFVQVFAEREWLALPTLTQRVLAVYVLGFQFFQAFAGLMAPVALALALGHKSSVLIALLATIPLGLNLLAMALDVVLLRQFGRAFRQRVRLRDYAGLVLGYYPYQIVLSVAAVWAITRYLLGRNNWVKTAHSGAHLSMVAHVPAGGRAVGRVPA